MEKTNTTYESFYCHLNRPGVQPEDCGTGRSGERSIWLSWLTQDLRCLLRPSIGYAKDKQGMLRSFLSSPFKVMINIELMDFCRWAHRDAAFVMQKIRTPLPLTKIAGS